MVSNIKSTMCAWNLDTRNQQLLSAAQVHAAGTAWEWCQSKMEPHGVPKCEFGEL